MARWVARVRREGDPGPDPARMISGSGLLRLSRTGVSSKAGDGLIETYDLRIESMSASVMDARRRRGQYSQIWDNHRKRRVLAAL